MQNLRPVLEILSSKPISGQWLAKQLRVTRAGVWKQIRALQALHFPIKSHAKLGYSLDVSTAFPLLNPKFSAPLSHWAKPHLELSSTSTQVLAKRAAHSGAPEGHLWLSEVQSQGRGRLGRVWESGFGGLWFSLILRPQVPPSRAGTIGMLAALILAETIQAATKLPARLKWPNDVLLPVGKGFRKVAGFLTEMSGEIDKTEWIVLGVGLNVHNRLPKSLESVAISLTTSSPAGSGGGPLYRPPTTTSGATLPGLREEILETFLKRFYAAYRIWQRQGFEPFVQPYWKLYFKPKQPVELRTGQGVIRGIARCVDASGAIIVESRRKNRAVLEGDIVL